MAITLSEVTLSDVARTAGAHPGPASRALNPATRARVSPATAKIGAAAARPLLDLLTEPSSAKLLLLPTRLTERASIAPPRTS